MVHNVHKDNGALCWALRLVKIYERPYRSASGWILWFCSFLHVFPTRVRRQASWRSACDCVVD